MPKICLGRPMAAVVMAAVLAGPTVAQQVPSLVLETAPEAAVAERQSVSQRPRSDYDALGVPVESFVFYPIVDLLETFDSNLYSTPSNTKSDFITAILPSAYLNSNWSSDALNVQVNGNIKRYAQQGTEDNDNVSFLAGGRVDVLRDVYFRGGGGYQVLHEDRSSPNTINGKFPIEYDVASGNLGYAHEAGIVGFQIDGAVADTKYHNGISSTGTTLIDTNRSMTEYGVNGRISYELVPGYHAFVRAAGDWRDYAEKFDAGGFQRSSKGYSVSVGTAVQLGPTLNGEIYVGYLDQTFDDRRLKSASGPAFAGNLLWNVTPLTSLRAAVARTVEETIISPASSFFQTSISLGIEHELLRNVLLTGNLSYANQDYQGLNRADDVYGASVGARYLVNRNFSAGLNLAYSARRSNSVGIAAQAEFDRAQIGADIVGKF